MSGIIDDTVSSDKLTPVSNTKQVTFNPNPVTIPVSETCTTNTTSDSVTSIKGTIPIHDTSDPTKVKNVIVSVPSNGDNGQSDHTYARTNDDSTSNSNGKTDRLDEEEEEEEDVEMTSSSDDSSSESEESDTETEKPIITNKSSVPPPLIAIPDNKTTPSGKKRGRPRKYPLSATPQPAPPNKTDTPTPRRSILKVSHSAPVTPEAKVRKTSNGERIRKRGRGCGSCVGCVRDDCGKCPYCLDKPKYGGPGKKKQRCALRTCSQFVSVGKRLHTAKPLPDTPKTAAILSVAQSLVAAVHNASTNGDPIPLANPIQQAPSPSPNQVETPIIKIPEENFKAISGFKNTPVAMTTSASSTKSSIESPKPTMKMVSCSSSSSSGSPASSKFITRSYNKIDHDGDMKCVVCARWRKVKLAKSEKFCTLRCMKSWIDSNPGQNPEDAEPNDKNMLFMPPTTSIPNDAPRAIKKLLINMALPGSQPVSPAVAPVSSSTVPFTTTMMSTISNNISSLLNAVAPNSSSPPCTSNGIKRNSQESPNVLSKKFKEAPVAVTCSTKTVTTSQVSKSSRINNSLKKKGPNDLPVDVSKWGVPEVVKFFQSKPECQIFASMLKEQEIDGPALLLLSHDSLVKCLDIKLGPALKIMTHVEQLKQQQATHT